MHYQSNVTLIMRMNITLSVPGKGALFPPGRCIFGVADGFVELQLKLAVPSSCLVVGERKDPGPPKDF